MREAAGRGGTRGAEPPMEATRDRRRRRTVLGTCGSAHFLHDGFSDVLYVLFPLWAGELGLSLTQVGFLKAVYSGALALFQIPASLLSERYGERVVLAFGTAVTGLGFVFLGAAGAFPALVVLLLIAGAGSGTQHPLSSSLVAKAYESGGRRAALGTYNFAGDLGKVAVVACFGLAIAAFGWRASATVYGVLGALAALAIFIVLRSIERHPAPREAPAQRPVPTGLGWGIRNRSGFRVICSIGVIDSAVRYGFLTFLPFLLIAKGAAVETVGFALALVFGGGAAGKLLCGFLAERLGIIRTAALTEIGTGAGIVALMFVALGPALIVLPLVGFALNGTSSVLYGTVAEFVTAERQSRAYGLFYTLGIGAGAIAPAILGIVSDRVGVPGALGALAVAAFATLPLCAVLSRSIARPA